MDKRNKISDLIKEGEKIKENNAAESRDSARLGIIDARGIGTWTKGFDRWRSDVILASKRILNNHPLKNELDKCLTHKKFNEIMGVLEAVLNDEEYFKEEVIKEDLSEYRQLPSGLSIKAHDLLLSIVKSDNPTAMLAGKFNDLESREDDELRSIIRDLVDNGYIKIFWADDLPYTVQINLSAKAYVAEHQEMNNAKISKEEFVITYDKKSVFIVHGHDDDAITKIENFLRKMELTPIILRDQASMGKTIIEKLENYTDVGFAIVLYTPCDEMNDGKFRARQNVVIEHGYLMGKIGRNRVASLVKGEVETPGDISGVVYIQMDSGKQWEHELVKELKAAGYSADANSI